MNKLFPNGLEDYLETYYEIVSHLSYLDNECTTFTSPVIDKIYESHGKGGLYDLAKELTDKFEYEYYGRVWDGEFLDEIDKFLQRELYRK